MSFESSTIADVGLIHAPFHKDDRGSFEKIFSEEALAAAHLEFSVAEFYWSRSLPGTIRGMHLQLPPTAVQKIVLVLAGRIRDVVIDLRTHQPTFGIFAEWTLAPGDGAVVVPVGCAHGFEVLGDSDAVVGYLQSGAFDPATDTGIRWDFADAPWTTSSPIVSSRDRSLDTFADFDSPFR